MINEALLDKVLDHVTAHPEEHDQGAWLDIGDCGTTACFAGHAVLMSGHEPYADAYAVVVHGGKLTTVDRAARDELGLTYRQAGVLFDPNNTLDDLTEIVDKIKKGWWEL